MDPKLLKSSDKESIRIAMLKHEEMFRDQVQELHRLYRKQKLLMRNMENVSSSIVKPIIISEPKEEAADLKSEELIEESEIQLTLGPSVYKSKQRRTNSGQSLCSSNSTGWSQIQNKEAKCRKDSTWEFARSTQSSVQMNLGEEHLRQDRMKQHPPWLFQALSLKLT